MMNTKIIELIYPMTSVDATIIMITLIIIGLLVIIGLIILLVKNNRQKEDEQLIQQSIIIKHLSEEISNLKEKIEKKSVSKKKDLKIIEKDKNLDVPLSKDELKKREEKRKNLENKVQKKTNGKKLSISDLKKFQLTDLYGIAKKRAKFFSDNGRGDIVELSKMDVSNISKEFINNFPASKLWTFEMKKNAIISNIKEAKHMVQLLTK